MSDPLRITFVVPHDSLSGGVRAIACHAEGLAQRGHQVVVASGAPRHRRRPLAERLRRRDGGDGRAGHLAGLSVEQARIPSGRPFRDSDLPDADVVIATWWETARAVAQLAPGKGAKAYLVQDFGAHAGQPLDRVAASWRLPLHKIAVSHWLGELVRAHAGGEALDVVPHGIASDVFRAVPRERRDPLTIGFAYSTLPHKGLPLMLAAIDRAREEHRLAVASYGIGRPQPDLPLPRGTRYLQRPTDPELAELYRSCDLWLFGSSRDGFGLPILEAMACRTPVVAVRAGAAPELVGRGGGILLDSHAPEEMARAIAHAASQQPDAWARLSEDAETVARGASWERATAAFEAALQHAVAGRPPAGDAARRA